MSWPRYCGSKPSGTVAATAGEGLDERGSADKENGWKGRTDRSRNLGVCERSVDRLGDRVPDDTSECADRNRKGGSDADEERRRRELNEGDE